MKLTKEVAAAPAPIDPSKNIRLFQNHLKFAASKVTSAPYMGFVKGAKDRF